MAASVSGQSNFKDAVVIANGGDTIHGKIDYRNWRYNPKTITFQDATGKTKALTPTDIREFMLPAINEHYYSAAVSVDPLSDNGNKALNDIPQDTADVHNYFLLQLIQHPSANLYMLTKTDRDHFYYSSGQGQPKELIHHFDVDAASGELIEAELYKGQLATLFEACPKVASDLQSLKYKAEDLKKAFSAYLQCAHGTTVTDNSKKKPVGPRFGVIAGMTHTTYSLEGFNPYLVDENYSSSSSPTLGAMVDLTLSRNLSRLHVVNELVFKNYKTSSTFTRPFNLNYTRTSTVEFDLSYLQLNTMLRYLLIPLNKVNPYINIGVSNAFMIAENKNSIHNVYSYGSEETIKAFDGMNRYEFTPVVAGAGVNTKHFTAEVRYSYSKRGFSNQGALETNPRTWWLLLTYKF